MADVSEERIQFRLRADRTLWNVPNEIETNRPKNAHQLQRNNGGMVEKSIYSPIYEDDFNGDEAEFACYLDEAKALHWWYRNVAQAGNYWIQGWKRNRVYPDFIFARERQSETDQILVCEMKDDQLEGNPDTNYKRKLLETVSTHYRAEDTFNAGTLELIGRSGEAVRCDLVLMSQWNTEVQKKFES